MFGSRLISIPGLNLASDSLLITVRTYKYLVLLCLGCQPIRQAILLAGKEISDPALGKTLDRSSIIMFQAAPGDGKRLRPTIQNRYP